MKDFLVFNNLHFTREATKRKWRQPSIKVYVFGFNTKCYILLLKYHSLLFKPHVINNCLYLNCSQYVLPWSQCLTTSRWRPPLLYTWRISSPWNYCPNYAHARPHHCLVYPDYWYYASATQRLLSLLRATTTTTTIRQRPTRRQLKKVNDGSKNCLWIKFLVMNLKLVTHEVLVQVVRT